MGAWYFSSLAEAYAASLNAWASSSVAPAASASLLVASAIRCSTASAWRAFSISAYSTALLANASAVACCFRCSFCAFFSNCACSSCSVVGSRRCHVRCSVSILACFPLSISRRSSRCRMPGVRGIGSLPLLPRDPDPTLTPDTELKLSLSLSLPSVPLPSGANGAYAFFSSVIVFPLVVVHCSP